MLQLDVFAPLKGSFYPQSGLYWGWRRSWAPRLCFQQGRTGCGGGKPFSLPCRSSDIVQVNSNRRFKSLWAPVLGFKADNVTGVRQQIQVNYQVHWWSVDSRWSDDLSCHLRLFLAVWNHSRTHMQQVIIIYLYFSKIQFQLHTCWRKVLAQTH